MSTRGPGRVRDEGRPRRRQVRPDGPLAVPPRGSPQNKTNNINKHRITRTYNSTIISVR